MKEGGCEHVQPADVARMAEELLKSEGIQESEWGGRRFGVAENLVDAAWKSVRIEVERRGQNWVAVKLERKPEFFPAAELGFYCL